MNRLLVLVIIALFPAPSRAWGIHGHRIVAYLAQGLLSDNSLVEVASLIGSQTLPEIATWADEVDHTPAYAWSKCMHYIDASGETCSVSVLHDCASGCCVLAAIGNYTDRLFNAENLYNETERNEALKFVVHLMGDLHQPLHAGSKVNQGGNALHVLVEFNEGRPETLLSEAANLHAVWDTLMIDYFLHTSQHVSWEQYGSTILEKVKNGQYDYLHSLSGECAQSIADQTCLVAAADESAQDACAVAYVTENGDDIANGTVLTHAYFVSRIITVEERLVMAGVRLGSLLNQILTPTSTQSSNYIVQVM